MTPEHETRIYNDILRDVLWGAEKQDLLQKLETNGISGERAERLFARARKERLSLIRSKALWQAGKGLVLVMGGLGLFFSFWEGARGISRGVFVTCFAAWAFGGYWLVDGIVATALASAKKGSVGFDD